ncbi:MAG: hypothetical protein U1E73_10630 [Planctomycetota bacterium]
MTLLLALVSAALPGSGSDHGGPAPFHAFAAVNDVLSHGQVGDNFLSLNEAIQLHNNTLTAAQLSPAEQAQIALIPGTGTSTFLSWVRFDASSTPVITIERDLDVIVDTSYGLYLSSDNGETVLDFTGAGITRGMTSTSNSLQMRDLVFSGGPTGVDVVQTDIAGQIGLALSHCTFVNQAQFGVRIASITPNGFGKFYADACTFTNCGSGVLWDEPVAGRTSFFDLHDCRMTGLLGMGVVLGIGPGGGGLGRYTIERVDIEAGSYGIWLSRSFGGTRPAQLLFRHLRVRAATGVDIDCSAGGQTTLQMQMLDLRGTAGNGALLLGQTGDLLGGVIEDSTFDGGVRIAGTGSLAVNNLRVGNASCALDAGTGAARTYTDCRFNSCTITVGGQTTMNFVDCSFAGSTVGGSAGSPVVCTDSFVPTPWFYTTVLTPRPQEQLGSMHVLPDHPAIGTPVVLQADLPSGLFGAFLIGFTELYPQLLPQPLHVYGQLAATWLAPGIYTGQQSMVWMIPNAPIYRGLDFVGQIAVLPNTGVSALPVQLPPGRRFKLL